MDINGIITYITPESFEMAEEFSGDGAILEEVVYDLKADGCTCIRVQFYDDED